MATVIKRLRLFIAILLLAPLPAFAGQTEARAVAMANNCSPKKIEVLKNAVGEDGQTIYRVQCNLPKTLGDADTSAPNALLINCEQNMCEMMSAINTDDKK